MSSVGILDPTKVGKYPVVLSDALLNGKSKDVYTGIRYNHKPALSSSTAPTKARLKPASGDDSYDLSFRDDGGQYAYQGMRSTEDNKYVLIFDPAREVLVLHKVDSTFAMNLTQTPSNDDPESLRRKYPQLEGPRKAKSGGPSNSGGTKSKTKDSGRNSTALRNNNSGSKKGKDLPMPPKNALQQQKQQQQQQAPMPAKKQAQRATSDSEDDDSSDDGLLQIEEPGGPTVTQSSTRDFSPAFGTRRFSEFVQQNTEEEDDADGEDDDDAQSIEHFTLPSPVNRQMEASAGLSRSNERSYNAPPPQPHQAEEEEESDEDADAEMEDVQEPAAGHEDQDETAMDEDDLEAEFMAAFEDEEGQQDQQESDVSEEE